MLNSNMKIKFIYFILKIVFLTAIPSLVNAQKLLQLEIYRQVEAVKFFEGSTITFKTKTYPKEWKTKKIERIITDGDLLIFEDGMLSLNEIIQFRLNNATASAFGKMFTGFGAGWFLFGGIAQLAGDYKFSWGTFAIGAVSLGVGWLLNKVVSKKTYKMGKNANLRILDISFPSVQLIPPVKANVP